MRWDQGRAVIDLMLADHELQRVPASREHAGRLIAQARDHLLLAAEICDTDPRADTRSSATPPARP